MGLYDDEVEKLVISLAAIVVGAIAGGVAGQLVYQRLLPQRILLLGLILISLGAWLSVGFTGKFSLLDQPVSLLILVSLLSFSAELVRQWLKTRSSSNNTTD